MTKKELLELISEYPDDLVIVISSKNGHSVLDHVDDGCFTPDNSKKSSGSYSPHMLYDGKTEEAIFLYPTY